MESDPINVLSLFDGISCGKVALDRAAIKVSNYFSSEIDKHAMKISKKNHPEVRYLGDITNFAEWELPAIGLVIGGSPCQGFSRAGKNLAFEDPRSKLLLKFVEVLMRYRPKYFLLENVNMNRKNEELISCLLGTDPVRLNSSLVSAQNRERLYWTNINIRNIDQKNIGIQDILMQETFSSKKVNDNPRVKGISENLRGYRPHRGDAKKSGISELGTILKIGKAKSDCLTTSHPPKIALNADIKNLIYRQLSPVECERLQTLPDNYTHGASDTQRYKMLGNGWTVDLLSAIFSGMINTC